MKFKYILTLVASTLWAFSAQSQILISEIHDPSDNFNNRFVEIVNIGVNTIDISNYSMERYANGNTSPSVLDVPNGTVMAPGDVFVFVSQTASLSLTACSGSISSTSSFEPISGNGDDVYALHDGATIIDVYGVIGVDGTGTPWEYLDSRVLRKPTVSGPSSTFDLTEWDIIPTSPTADADPCISQFTMACALLDLEAIATCTGLSLDIVVSWTDLNTSGMMEISVNGAAYSPFVSGNTYSISTPSPAVNNAVITVRDQMDITCSSSVNIALPSCPTTGLSNLDTMRMMTYNILNFPNSALDGVPNINDAARTVHFREIVEEAEVDVIVLQECTSGAAVSILVDELNNNGTAGTTWSFVTYTSSEPVKNGCIYNEDKLNFIQVFDIAEANTYNGQSAVRPNTVFVLEAESSLCPSEKIEFQFISTHTKAGQNPSDIDQRTAQMLDLIDHLNAESVNANIICGGDYNLYADDNDGSGDDEPGYVFLTDNSNAKLLNDVLGGWTRDVSSNVSKYTQSTMSANTHGHIGSAGGGLDDRFDFLFINNAVQNGMSEMSFIPGTYTTFGSEGVNWNQSATTGNSPVKTQLEYMSDHYPVILDVALEYTNCSTCPTSSTQGVTYNNVDILVEVQNDINATNVIDVSSNVFYSAGTQICLDAGFEVTAGSTFEAYIDGCNP